MPGFPPTDKTLEGLLRDTQVRLDLLERRIANRGGAPADTGWTDFSALLVTGFTGTVQGRRVGAHAQLRSNDLTGPLPTSSSAATTFLNALPVDWRPSASTWGTAAASTFQAGACLIRSVGTVAIAQNSGAAWTAARFTVDYFIA